LPLHSLTTCLLACQLHNILPRDPWVKHDEKSIKFAKTLIQAERAEACSSMPLYWSKIDKGSFIEPPAYLDLTAEPSDDSSDDESFYKILKKREERKRKIESLSNACTRKWKVSVKVANVSSRTVLARPEMQPMYCIAIFPSYVQSGQSLTVESAQLKDKEEGLGESLGSYDCRATAANPAMSFEAMTNKDIAAGKDNGAGRSKRINVGRSRLIWSKARMSASKATFTSMLTGLKLDAATYKRPKEAKVSIRLSGKVISAISADIGDEGKQKRTSGNLFTDKVKWSKNKVHEALNTASKDSLVEQEDSGDTDDPFPSNAQCTLDPEEYLESLVKNIKLQDGKRTKKQGRDSISSVDDVTEDLMSETTVIGGAIVPKYVRPKFFCLPLGDGLIRTHCESPGTMNGSLDLPKLLKSVASMNSSGPLCTVCWTGSETYQVLQCLKCGLLSHRDCCLDGGEYVTNSKNDLVWKCTVCEGVPYVEILPTKPGPINEEPINHSSSSDNDQGGRKSRRTSRLPRRFKEEAESATSLPQKQKQPVSESSLKCTLCPHSGE